MVSSGLSRAVHSAVPGCQPVDVRHFLNFVTFQMAILAFYALARRLLAIGPALVATLLFASQPVLFGHAFINQKNIPFLAAIALDLRVTDGARASREPDRAHRWDTPDPSAVSAFVRGWQGLHVRQRIIFLVLAFVGGAVTVDLWWGRTILTWCESIVASAYRGEAWGPLSALFARVASDAYKTPLEAYVAKLDGVFGWARLVGTYLAALPGVATGLAIAERGGDSGIDGRRVVGRVVPASFSVSPT